MIWRSPVIMASQRKHSTACVLLSWGVWSDAVGDRLTSSTAGARAGAGDYSSLVHLPPMTCRVPSGSVRQSRWQYGYLRQQSRSDLHDEPYQQSTQTCAERSQMLKRRQHSRSPEHTSRKHILSGSSFHGNLPNDSNTLLRLSRDKVLSPQCDIMGTRVYQGAVAGMH